MGSHGRMGHVHAIRHKPSLPSTIPSKPPGIPSNVSARAGVPEGVGDGPQLGSGFLAPFQGAPSGPAPPRPNGLGHNRTARWPTGTKREWRLEPRIGARVVESEVLRLGGSFHSPQASG